MTTSDIPVLIVGAGPAGLTASLLLSRLGVDSLLVERRATTSPLPRARGVHARAMEILRGCGLEPALREVELPITPGAEWRARLTGPPLREDVPRSAPTTSPCDGLSVAQDVFESVLTAHLTAPIRRGVALESFTTIPDGVRATVHDEASGRRETVRARWLIAADGARSGVRERLGIAMRGPADLGRHRLVAFRADLTPWTGPRPRGIYFLTESSAALVWTHPDHRWMVSLPETDGGEPPDIAALLGVPVEVLAGGPWTAAAQTAERYADGPVFLVGDAAHRFPPAGATGLSAAIHDAHNLVWKLAAVFHGHAGPALIDSYRAEREPVGSRNADETGEAWTRIFSGTGAPFAGRSLAQIDMGYQYRSAVITADGTPDADPPGADYKQDAAPGCRAPHLWLSDGRSTLDLFGTDHTLLTAPTGTGWRRAAEPAAARLGVPLSSHVITDPDWPTAYGTTPDGAVLVRPDGHVAWRHAGPATADGLLAALTTATAR
jgi:putative polyketide hydroxylase